MFASSKGITICIFKTFNPVEKNNDDGSDYAANIFAIGGSLFANPTALPRSGVEVSLSFFLSFHTVNINSLLYQHIHTQLKLVLLIYTVLWIVLKSLQKYEPFTACFTLSSSFLCSLHLCISLPSQSHFCT